MKKEGGSGWGKLPKGKPVSGLTGIKKLKVGDILLSYNAQFNSKNVVRVQSFPKDKDKGHDRFYGLFVDPDNTKNKRSASDKNFCIWWWELNPPNQYYLTEINMPDINMPESQLVAIMEFVAEMTNHGLNSREIANRMPKVTKAELIMVIKHYQQQRARF